MIGYLIEVVCRFLCHQEAGRSWAVAGETLPLCARCTGVYAGFALSAALVPIARFRPTPGVLWLHGAAMLQMVVFGFHLVEPQAAWLRTLSGSLFAAGTIYFLSLPYRSSRWGERDGKRWPYFTGILAGQIGLQVFLHWSWGNYAALLAIILLFFVGMAAVVLFAVLSACALVGRLRKQRRAA
jgi:uncharacterized membrane protein